MFSVTERCDPRHDVYDPPAANVTMGYRLSTVEMHNKNRQTLIREKSSDLEEAELLISLDCVFDASLVPETCPNRFVDSRELTRQVSGESDYLTSALGALEHAIGSVEHRGV